MENCSGVIAWAMSLSGGSAKLVFSSFVCAKPVLTPISDKVVGCSSNSIAVGTSYVMSIGTGTEACQEVFGQDIEIQTRAFTYLSCEWVHRVNLYTFTRVNEPCKGRYQ
jgi:hypothetical protein